MNWTLAIIIAIAAICLVGLLIEWFICERHRKAAAQCADQVAQRLWFNDRRDRAYLGEMEGERYFAINADGLQYTVTVGHRLSPEEIDAVERSMATMQSEAAS